jgi:putative phosphoserine phosphatase/1-acylglycerol-3-phosphate O-acyltransferase
MAQQATSAAIFDLDRTLLRGASAPVITKELRIGGVVEDRSIPGEGLLYSLFDRIGETLPSMLLTRQLARMAEGWDRSSVQAAGVRAAEVLLAAVQPYARQIIEGHRAEGRRLIMATTTPYDLVKPLADALEFDAVVATRYGVTDGMYNGTIDGEFVWGKGKLAAVLAWIADAGGHIDLADSWAYSDSFYDLPLLSAVAHPVAVNPDLRLQAVAALRRWSVLHLDAPPGVPKVLGVEAQNVLLPLARPEIFPYARFDISGTDNIPAAGPAIVCGNHRSYFDPLAVAVTVGKAGRPIRFLGKKEVFDAPVVGQVAKALGGIRVDRGTGSDEPLKEAARALEGGELVAIMPEGTIPRGYAFFKPTLKGRWGAARLAAMTGAPIVPLGLWGTEQVWPRNSRVPNLFNITSPPTIRARVGEPFHVGGEDADADTTAIMEAIVALLPDEAREKHDPTPEELARTFPSGTTPHTEGDDPEDDEG